MTLGRIISIGAFCLAMTILVGQAQAQYPAYPYHPGYSYYQAPAAPRSWSYDPYTSGLSPCPQWFPGDLQTCSQQMPPTYGQPSFWSR